MSIDSIIQEAVVKAVNELYGLNVEASSVCLQSTRKGIEGNLAVVVFPWVKAAKKSPEAVGNEIGEWLVKNEPSVVRFNTVKGF